jgi:putative adenylate-forming enzyme
MAEGERVMRVMRVLGSYWQDRHLAFATRGALLKHQAMRLAEFRRRLCARSRFYAPFKSLPLVEWPETNKEVMLRHFDDMNTAGLTLSETYAAAMAAEQTRDFTSTLRGVNIGLSSGTSGRRGVFAISDLEATKWAGIVLSRMLPDGLLAGERVALFLRANSRVYESVRSRCLSFRFFDLFDPLEEGIEGLKQYDASIVVAPAQVLRELALRKIAGRLGIAPKVVVSVAEVLEPMDRTLIEQAFPKLREIYQATEGLLAATCRLGTLHLMEEYVHVEPRWLDQDRRRFVPVITDFTRLTQPFVRYRLDDVLHVNDAPCPCGRVTRTLAAIEGRCDDALVLPGAERAPVVVFGDVLSRALARHLPQAADYRLVQTGIASLRLHATVAPDCLVRLRDSLSESLLPLGVDVHRLSWELHPDVPAADARHKRRRIQRNQALQ